MCCSSTGIRRPADSARGARETFPTEADAACSSSDLDDVALRQLASAVTVDLAVQSRGARFDEQLGLSPGAGKPAPLQELTQGDRTFHENGQSLDIGVSGHAGLASR